MHFQFAGNFPKLVIDFRKQGFQFTDGVSHSDSRDNVFNLGVHKKKPPSNSVLPLDAFLDMTTPVPESSEMLP